MVEKIYFRMNETILPDGSLIENTVQQAVAPHVKRKQIRFKPMLVAGLLGLCLVAATPVLAACVPSIYELMYQISPELAQHFAPIQESCEDNGIRMEVVATYIHENIAEIYVTMQDLTGNRIDETIDLFDSYSIHRAFDSTAHSEFIDYDEDKKTATFLISISEWDNTIIGSKITFSVREFLSHQVSLEDVSIPINLSSIGDAETMSVRDGPNADYTIVGYGDQASFEKQESYEFLSPGKSIYQPATDLDVTGIGLIDGKLHIQLATAEKISLGPHGYFYLVNPDGNQIQSTYSIGFAKDIDTDNRTDYQEFIYDMPEEGLENYKLNGCFYTSGLNTKGNWKVTFDLINSEE